MLTLDNYLRSFKSYDIRGIWDKEIDADLGYLMGKGLAQYILEHTGKQARILIAADTRPNNTLLIDHTIQALHEAGLTQFINAGLPFDGYPHGICSTSMAYQLGYQTCDYYIIFSASHNSAEYIGIKIYTGENLSIPTSILQQLFLQAREAQDGSSLPNYRSTEEILSLYQDNTLLEPNKKKRSDNLDRRFGQLQKAHSFAIDYGHGAAVAYELDYVHHLGTLHPTLSTLNLFTNPDGSFPAHETDTSRFSNYEKLIQAVQDNDLKFGFMFDGDADRLGIVLKNGTVMTGDIITAIVAKQALTNGMAAEFGSKQIFYEVFSSHIVKNIAALYGGTSTMVRVGRGAFCKQVMDEKGVIAGECSAHILFGPYGYAEIPLLALALVVKESEQFESFDAMAAHYMSSHKSQVYHFAIADKDGLMKHVDESYPELTKSYVDGVRMDGPGFWFTVRKSGTEDIVKVAGEGSTQEVFDREWNKLKQLILDYGAHEE